MKRPEATISVKGRFLGVALLVVIQFIVGVIHIILGLATISVNPLGASFSMTYNVYTLVYGCLTVFFTYLLWNGKRLGWIGTVATSIFVIVVDSLAAFDVSNILSIPAPKFAAIGKITFSILVLAYLLQHHVTSKYNI
ncbi:MAG: hypothetical protein WC325_00990 [Candidatus Bathyarchaeia archaeon]|jgi:hypothetical protein